MTLKGRRGIGYQTLAIPVSKAIPNEDGLLDIFLHRLFEHRPICENDK